MKNVRIAFATSGSLLARVIRWFSKVETDRVVFLVEMDGQEFVVTDGFHLQSLDSYEDDLIDLFASDELELDLDSGVCLLVASINEGRGSCVATASDLLAAIGLPAAKRLDSQKISPTELLLFLRTRRATAKTLLFCLERTHAVS